MKSRYLVSVGIFATWLVIMAIGLSFGQATTGLPDPDGYYHMAMAQHLDQFGFSGTFQPLSETTLGQHYVDQHFVLHAVLFPFVTWLPDLLGLKVFVVLAHLMAMLAVLWVVKRWQGNVLLATVLLSLCNPWLFRLALVKATPLVWVELSLAFLILSLKSKRMQLWLIPLAYLYVFTHGGFILLLIVTGIWAVIVKRSAWPVIYTSLGMGLALLTQPGFPNNLWFYWEQLFQIGVVNYQSTIGVGGEWYPYAVWNLVTDHSLILAAAVVTVAWLVMQRKLITREGLAMVVFTGFVVALTLKSRRYVEYVAPAAVITIAMQWPATWAVFSRLAQCSWRQLILPYALGCAVIVAIVPVAITEWQGLQSDLRQTSEVKPFLKLGEWLKQQSVAPAERPKLVAPSDWDDFPALFYVSPNLRFLIGLDATFLYRQNAERYLAWRDLTLGTARGDIDTQLAKVGADYIVVSKDHGGMQRLVTKSMQVTLLYQDSDVWLYGYNLK